MTGMLEGFEVAYPAVTEDDTVLNCGYCNRLLLGMRSEPGDGRPELIAGRRRMGVRYVPICDTCEGRELAWRI